MLTADFILMGCNKTQSKDCWRRKCSHFMYSTSTILCHDVHEVGSLLLRAWPFIVLFIAAHGIYSWTEKCFTRINYIHRIVTNYLFE